MLQPEPIVLYKAAEDGKLDEVKAAVDAGAEMEWANPGPSYRYHGNGRRAVHQASVYGHKDVVAFLGSRGADVNAVMDYQSTPLQLAAYNGHASVCTTLLALGADPAAKNDDGETALDDARNRNRPECVAVLEAWAAGERDPEALAKAAADAPARVPGYETPDDY
eukprot:COSAG06_NODE_1451_length_9435_cov_11.764353_2_plen_165_part_00